MDGESGFQVVGDAPVRYERHVSPIMAPFVGALVDAVRLAPGEAVLDVGCGTGFAAREAARRVGADGRVEGVDLNSGMLAVAAEQAPEVGWSQASAEALPFEDGEFDVVLCQQSAQFFADLDAALAEAARVTRRGGRFGATVWASLEGSPFFVAQRLAIEAIAGAEAARSFDAAFACPARVLVSAVRRAGFSGLESRDVTAEVRLPRLDSFAPLQLAALPWGRAVADAGPTAPAAYADMLADLLNPYVGADQSVLIPFASTLVTGTR
ncbi:class I SAM-dependent methyltransferase [Yinghuangia sp. YIM S09857]|uniref:class I SAM-dependent methyltransferase n=1 Tax=Yinghuangia sp. YIM S09857 TaxID=3436929 RepID=UPI003F536FA7